MAPAHISTTDRLRAVDAWWRAANYLTVGQIYLLDNPLLSRPIEPDDVKPRLLGHWGTSPALNLVYAHCNALITETGREFLYICGPGHGMGYGLERWRPSWRHFRGPAQAGQ